jgi:hypothetical protein
VFAKTYHATHPDMMDCVSNDELRDRYLVTDMFQPGQVTLNYSHNERFVIGGVVPGRGRWHCRSRPNRPARRGARSWNGANWRQSTSARRGRSRLMASALKWATRNASTSRWGHST